MLNVLESFTNLHQRSQLFIEQLLKSKEVTPILITHAGNIRSFICHAIGLELTNTFRIEIPYGAIVKLELSADPNESKLLNIIT